MRHTTVRVAIIDDDFRILEALEDLFTSAGLCPLLFSSAEDFLTAGIERKVACIVSDIEMPGIDGVELLTRVKGCLPGTPVILISAHHHLEDAPVYTDLGAAGYFAKPFDSADLLATVQQAITAVR